MLFNNNLHCQPASQSSLFLWPAILRHNGVYLKNKYSVSIYRVFVRKLSILCHCQVIHTVAYSRGTEGQTPSVCILNYQEIWSVSFVWGSMWQQFVYQQNYNILVLEIKPLGSFVCICMQVYCLSSSHSTNFVKMTLCWGFFLVLISSKLSYIKGLHLNLTA